MTHKMTPDWFYPDDLDIEAGLANLNVYSSVDEEEAGRLFFTLDDGDKVVTGELTYDDVADLHRYTYMWLMWAEDQGYDDV